MKDREREWKENERPQFQWIMDWCNAHGVHGAMGVGGMDINIDGYDRVTPDQCDATRGNGFPVRRCGDVEYFCQRKSGPVKSGWIYPPTYILYMAEGDRVEKAYFSTNSHKRLNAWIQSTLAGFEEDC